MTDCGKLTNIVCCAIQNECVGHCNHKPCTTVEIIVDDLIANGVVVQQWRDAKTDPPELPDHDFCYIIVCANFTWCERSEPMYYERTVIRDKRVERWKYITGRIAPTPDKWQPLPEPPKE
jgi:hypothetical protein